MYILSGLDIELLFHLTIGIREDSLEIRNSEIRFVKYALYI